MVGAIRQILTVNAEGTLEIRAPELRAGEQAEVIVLINRRGDVPASAPSLTPLEALKRLQDSLKLTPQAARKWVEEAQAERKAWGSRG